MSIFSSITHFLTHLFTPQNAKKVEDVLTAIAPLLQQALPIVEALAKASPNRTVQEIAEIAIKFGVPYTPGESVTEYLRAVAVNALGQVAGSDTATSLLNLAVELAVSMIKQGGVTVF